MRRDGWSVGSLRNEAPHEVSFSWCVALTETSARSASIIGHAQFVGRWNRGITQVLALVLGVFRLPSGCADVLGDTLNGNNWAGYGRTYDEAHYSPLGDINTSNVSQLGLAWWFDIPGVVLATSVPLEVDGRLYFATGYSVVRAVEATTGRLLWTYDPEVPKVAGGKLRVLWGIRGIAFWNDKVIVGTHDGRLIAIDAKTGKRVWSVETTHADDLGMITGPPLAFNGRVVIGHGGSEFGSLRGYVTAYDSESGKQLWRFFTVPGDPKKGFESKAMEMAAKTWSGQWWKYGGGGAVWNAMTYDPEFNRIYIGTSNGSPWNQKIRSPGGGDNLFLASIVALDANTGEYVWHYQTNPGDVWDYDATTDIELANVVIEGTQRRVLMQASKNGFFYVIDRDTGKLISAEKFAKVTWAEKIDFKTGRPLEAHNARYESGEMTVWPGSSGAHGPQPMAFNPTKNLVYIPMLDVPGEYNDKGINFKAWQPTRFVPSIGLNVLDPHSDNMPLVATNVGTSSLVAWDPLRQHAAWRVALPGIWNGGIATTAGNLVFQGRYDGKFAAYSADTGKELWSFDAQVGIIGAPITYKVANRQYVSVMAGFGASGSAFDPMWDARTQARRLLTFTLDGEARLPSATPRRKVIPVGDPKFKSNARAEHSGATEFGFRCAACHGISAVAGGAAPDLRASPAILSANGFLGIVARGTLLDRGMPSFGELRDFDVENIRQYLRSRANELATNGPPRNR
jgi:quinohemoprotein ethanol dehydrogenase